MMHLVALLLAQISPPADPLTAPAVGPAATCLIVDRQLNYKVASADVLLVRSGGRWHRSRLPDGCAGLEPNRILIRPQASTRLCANDLFEVKDNFTPQVFALCRFGPFEPLDKASRF